eukprot:scaffold4013_cov140-Isochrysis_galbana.AAC.9
MPRSSGAVLGDSSASSSSFQLIEERTGARNRAVEAVMTARRTPPGPRGTVANAAAAVAARKAAAAARRGAMLPGNARMRPKTGTFGALFSFYNTEVRMHGNNRVKVVAYLRPMHNRNAQQMFA